MTLVDLSNWEQYFLFTFGCRREKNEITFFNADVCVGMHFMFGKLKWKNPRKYPKIEPGFVVYGIVRLERDFFFVVAYLFSKKAHIHKVKR